MSKKRKHYMLAFDAQLWPEVWKVLTEKFDLTVTRRCHSIDGEVPREAPPPDYFSFMRELHNVGNNLNQIAQKAHVLNVVDGFGQTA